MIDFAAPVRKSIMFEQLKSDERQKAKSGFSSNQGNTNSVFPDVARRIVSSSPATCVAMALTAGGIFGWLTSRR